MSILLRINSYWPLLLAAIVIVEGIKRIVYIPNMIIHWILILLIVLSLDYIRRKIKQTMRQRKKNEAED